MVTNNEYAMIKFGKPGQHAIFAGEFHFKEGKLIKWTARSGHFWPDDKKRNVFAEYWGLTNTPYEDWRRVAKQKQQLLLQDKTTTRGDSIGGNYYLPLALLIMCTIICCVSMLCAFVFGFGCYFVGRAVQ